MSDRRTACALSNGLSNLRPSSFVMIVNRNGLEKRSNISQNLDLNIQNTGTTQQGSDDIFVLFFE